MDIIISEYIEYNHNEIINLYESVGWANYVEHPQRLREGYKNSLCVLAAYKDTELVGILRAVGDNATILFIQDIIVLPKYQRMGIGTKLIKSVMVIYALSDFLIMILSWLVKQSLRAFCFRRYSHEK